MKIKNIPFEYSNDSGSVTITEAKDYFVIHSFDWRGSLVDSARFTDKRESLKSFNILANRLESLCQIR